MTEQEHEGSEEQSLIDRVTSIMRRVGIGNGTSIVKVELAGSGAQSFGIWVSCTAAIVCFVAMMGLGGAVLYLARRVDDHQHQLNAIYMLAPTLRAAAEKEKPTSAP